MKSTFNFKLIMAMGSILIFLACKKQVEQPVDHFAGNPVEKVSMANSGKPSSHTGIITQDDSLSKYHNYAGSSTLGDSVRTK